LRGYDYLGTTFGNETTISDVLGIPTAAFVELGRRYETSPDVSALPAFSSPVHAPTPRRRRRFSHRRHILIFDENGKC